MDIMNEMYLGYSLSTVVIAIVGAVIANLSQKIFKFANPFYKIYIELFLGVALEFAYSIITVGLNNVVVNDTLYMGVIAGSLSSCFTALMIRIKNGKSIKSVLEMTIEGLIYDLVESDNLENVVELIIKEKENENFTEVVADIIEKNSKNLPQSKAKEIALLIYNQIKNK